MGLEPPLPAVVNPNLSPSPQARRLPVSRNLCLWWSTEARPLEMGELGGGWKRRALGSMHRLRPQLCPLRGPGQQHGTESRSDTPPRKAPSPRGAREAVLTYTMHDPVLCTHHARTGGEGMRWPRQGRPARAWPLPPGPPPRGFCFQFALGSEGAARPGLCCPTSLWIGCWPPLLLGGGT